MTDTLYIAGADAARNNPVDEAGIDA